MRRCLSSRSASPVPRVVPRPVTSSAGSDPPRSEPCPGALTFVAGGSDERSDYFCSASPLRRRRAGAAAVGCLIPWWLFTYVLGIANVFELLHPKRSRGAARTGATASCSWCACVWDGCARDLPRLRPQPGSPFLWSLRPRVRTHSPPRCSRCSRASSSRRPRTARLNRASPHPGGPAAERGDPGVMLGQGADRARDLGSGTRSPRRLSRREGLDHGRPEPGGKRAIPTGAAALGRDLHGTPRDSGAGARAPRGNN